MHDILVILVHSIFTVVRLIKLRRPSCRRRGIGARSVSTPHRGGSHHEIPWCRSRSKEALEAYVQDETAYLRKHIDEAVLAFWASVVPGLLVFSQPLERFGR